MVIQRADLLAPVPTTESGLIPTQYAREIIQDAAQSSMALSTFRQVRMPTGTFQLPVLDVMPTASWVAGEVDNAGVGGMKPATSAQWAGVLLTAEEIAAIVVIPEAVIEDTEINLWSELTPRISESIGAAIDRAVFLGNGPASFGLGIIPAAQAAGNFVADATPDQDDYSAAIAHVEEDGFLPDEVYAKVNQRAAFRGFNIAGQGLVYLTDVRDDGRVDSIYGLNVNWDMHGALGDHSAVVGDSDKAILGIRTDMQTKVLTEAMIDVSAEQDGSAMVNLAQQDAVALRVRMRLGFAVANPVTTLQPDSAERYPFAVISDTAPE